MPRVLHGLIQLAKNRANDLPYRIRADSTGINLFWIVERHWRGHWLHVCDCESQEEAEDVLMGKLRGVVE